VSGQKGVGTQGQRPLEPGQDSKSKDGGDQRVSGRSVEEKKEYLTLIEMNMTEKKLLGKDQTMA